uniref:Integrase, catalytic region, zinc finger, CCHC-type, peptidase aspartic, catalytic n=1 Tax=Tanacetum cinerariifolium TaxID=118510 RepID=A0A6L2NEQ3_TANCI|nr:integrase, catalytic region, zinc finger, CCHC-type, peptidase aspartic, catalytic [Tanacetum cinerariifolium]
MHSEQSLQTYNCLVQVIEATDDSPAIPKHTAVETPMNMTQENKAHFKAEKEAIHLILTGIGDEIYSTVVACQTAQEIWEAIERLQQEVNEIRAERLAREANPLALVATAQANQDPYYQTSKSYKSYAPSSKSSIPTRSHTTTRYKGKEIAKPITPPSKTASEKDIDPEQASRDKYMQKNLALIAKYFMKIYKPTNNNLRTSSNSSNKNVDMTPCNTCLVETDDSKVILDSPDMCEDAIQNDQNDVESDDEQCKSILTETSKSLRESISVRDSCMVALQTKQTEFEKHKAFNDRTIDYDKLELFKQKHDELMKQSLLTKSHYEGLVKKKTKVITDLKLREEHDIHKMLSMEKQLKFSNEIVYKRSQSIQTIHMMAPKSPSAKLRTYMLQEPITKVLLIKFVWKFLGTVRFENDHVATILGFGDLQWGNILITRVYFVEGLGHNLFSVGQFCDSDLEVAFRRNACFVRNLEGVDSLKGNRSTNLYTINLHEMSSASPICLMARASSIKSWL